MSWTFAPICSVFLGSSSWPPSNTGQWYKLFFSVPSSLLHPLHFFSSHQPMSYNLFCTQPPSTTSFLVTLRCLSVHASFVILRSIAMDWLQPHSFLQLLTLVLCCPFHSMDRPGLLQKHFSSCAQTTLCPPRPAFQTAKCATEST